jgi:peptidoglycan/LPS O-acetylase OafA/YrhL
MRRVKGGQSPPQHWRALDGLRGLAALTVVFRHCAGALPLSDPARTSLHESALAPLLNAQGAVQLFFVLSGFVLAGSLERNRHGVGLLQYYVKRVFRIHPPYVFGVLFAWLASFHYIVVAAPELSPWARELAGVHITPAQLLESFAWPGHAHHQLPVGWTLLVEMVLSLLLPLMLLIARRSHWIVLVALSGIVLWVPAAHWSLRFAIQFALGITAYIERERLAAMVRSISTPWQTAAVLVALAVYSAPMVLGWASLGPLTENRALIGYGLRAFGLVVLSTHVDWLQRALSIGPMTFLGRVSYSLYLVHIPVLMLLAPWFGGPPSWSKGLALTLCVTTLALAISELGFRLCEQPSIQLGNRVCRWLSRRTGGVAVPSVLADR